MCIIFNGTEHSVTGVVNLSTEKMKKSGHVLRQRSFFSHRLCTHCSSFCTSVTYSSGMNYPSIDHVVSVVHKVSLGQVLHTVFMTYLTCLESLYD
jgi:hypothetical protein